MSLSSRMAGLLAHIEQRRRAECGSMLDKARLDAASILREAHSAARRRVREGLEEQRRRARTALASARARLETRRRAAAHKRTGALLALGRARLVDALRKCWDDPAARSLWIDRQVSGALRALPKRGWEVRHPPDWTQEERRSLDERLAREGVDAPEYVADEAIACGILIRVAESVLDGTSAGILADSAEIEGRLLHHLQAPKP